MRPADVAKTRFPHQTGNRGALFRAMLDQQQRRAGQVVRRLGDDLAQRIQPVGARGERADRLVAQVALHEGRVAARDIGRIGHDHVEALAGQAGIPVALPEPDVLQAQAPGVVPGERKGGR